MFETYLKIEKTKNTSIKNKYVFGIAIAIILLIVGIVLGRNIHHHSSSENIQDASVEELSSNSETTAYTKNDAEIDPALENQSEEPPSKQDGIVDYFENNGNIVETVDICIDGITGELLKSGMNRINMPNMYMESYQDTFISHGMA